MGRQPAPLGRGDRVISFTLPDTAGKNRVFYFEVTGGPIVLFAYRTARDPDQAEALAGMVEAAPSLRETGAEIFAVSGDDVAANREAAERQGLDFPLFSDREGIILPQLLAAVPPSFPETKPFEPGFATFVLDPNQRVLGALQRPPAERHAAQALELLAAWAKPDGPRHVLSRAAPVLTLPDVFEPELCRTLIQAWEHEHQEGGVSDGSKNLLDPGKKRNLEHVVMDPALSRRIGQTLARRIGPELAKAFNYRAPFRLEGLTVLSYRADRRDFFGVHRDNVRQTRQRRFAISLNLNDDFEGGELRFPEYGPHTYAPRAGSALVFSCALLHEALPVTRGQRWVLTTFFCDPDPDPNEAGLKRRQVQV
jgi:peroxiredoxin/predicted 2-oxoglutarate/Fe(II)-dependent dioxygenase YbiX